MAGGNKKIRPEDGKQFSTDYQPAQVWTEENALMFGADLIAWLKELDEDGEDKGNIFFEEFIYLEAKPEKYHKRAKIYPELITYLSNKFLSFFNLIEIATKIQEIKLIKYGCADRLNSTMTKFVLTNVHGWRERSNSDLTTNGKDLNIQLLTLNPLNENDNGPE